MNEDAHNIAVTIQKDLKDRLSYAYTHPPIATEAESCFTVTGLGGRRFKVSVREISVEEELAAMRKGERV